MLWCADAISLLQREDLRKRATAFMGVSMATDRTQEDVLSTPQPGENLTKFYARSSRGSLVSWVLWRGLTNVGTAEEYWTQAAFATVGSNNRGKELRRDGAFSRRGLVPGVIGC